MRKRVAFLALCAGLGACENVGRDRVLGVDAIGVINGIVYFDVNGSRVFDVTDVPQPNVRVRFVARGTFDTTATGISDVNGAYRLAGIPVGTYDVLVDSGTVGDSVSLVRVDTTVITVRPADSTFVSAAVSYPIVTIAEARALALGTRVFVRGTALTSLATFGDSTIHLIDTSGTIRGARMLGAGLSIGDSLRLFGTRALRDGEPVLDNAVGFTVGLAVLPPAPRITTGVAVNASNGQFDAALIRVVNVAITDTATVLGDFVATIDDGSGPLELLFDADAGLVTAPYVPGAQVDALGVLVPTGTGTWQLKPRLNSDVILN